MRWSEFKAVYLGYCTAHKRPKTVENFDKPALKSFAFEGRLKDITPLHVTAWVKGLQDRYSPTTVAMMFSAVCAALNRAVKMGLLKKNPFDGLPRPSRKKGGRCLTKQEEYTLFCSAPEPLYTVGQFALHSGMRLEEIKALQWQHVRDQVANLPAESRKNGAALRMPLNSAARRLMGSPRTSGPVFVFRARTVQDQLKSLTERLGLGRIRFHDLRHTFLTRYMENGRAKDLVEMGTHKTENALNGYYHPPEQLYKDRIEVLAKEKPPARVIISNPWLGASSTSDASLRQDLRREGLEPSRLAAYAPQTGVIEFDHLGLA